MPHPLGDELTELHVHLGGSVDPAALWGIAHEQGIRLPTKDYWSFVDLITVGRRERKSFEEFLALYHWTELIQSSPLAVEQSVYEVVSVDMAGPANPEFRYRDYAPLFKRAKKSGLGVTIHAGEDEGWQSVDEVIE